jgi:hypothetical protein
MKCRSVRRIGGTASVLALGAAMLGGCATVTPSPLLASGASVHRLFADALVVRGVAESSAQGASCAQAAPTSSGVLVELTADTRATIALGPEKGGPPLPATVLHVTHLDSKRSWCIATPGDGSPAILADEFPEGIYAMAVVEPSSVTPRRFEIALGRL